VFFHSLRGALDLKNKTVIDASTKLKDCFMLRINDKMNKKVLKEIYDKGHSRVPIYRGAKEHIVGMLLVKNLILFDPSSEIVIGELEINRLPMVSSNLPLYSLLDMFQTGKAHMAVVLDEKDGMTPLGIITLEDVIEELIQEEIEDEDDYRRLKTSSEATVRTSFDDQIVGRQSLELTASKMAAIKEFIPQRSSSSGSAEGKDMTEMSTAPIGWTRPNDDDDDEDGDTIRLLDEDEE